MNKKDFKRMRLLLLCVVIVFLGVCLYLLYFQLFKAPELSKHARNSRNYVDETYIQRGSFKDRKGEVLAYSYKNENGSFSRTVEYPYSYAHLIGYNSVEHGKSALEGRFNSILLNLQGEDLIGFVRNILEDGKKGNDIQLTVDNELQTYGYSLLENHKGSVVVMNAKTGQVLTMVSSPSFNSNDIDSEWLKLIEKDEGALVNRSTQGQYTPGSIMKVVSAVAILESGVDQQYNDTGEEQVQGFTIYNYDNGADGEMGLEKALVRSTNTYFANKALLVGAQKMKQVAENFYFTKAIPFDLRVESSKVDYSNAMEKTDLAAAAYGQGKTLVSPLHMAAVISSLANKGKMMQPYMIEKILTPSGNTMQEGKAQLLAQVTSQEIANQMKDMLVRVVEDNSYLSLEGVKIGGKTGTAENASGKDHAWFIVFFEKGENIYSMAIVLEEEGRTGGSAAVPLASSLMYKMRDLGYFQ